jgi:hypothetical protein
MGRPRAVGPLRRIALPAALAGAALLAPPAHAYPAPNDPFLAAPSVVVSMEVTGGIGGIDDYLAIGSNRAARLDTRAGTRRFTVGRKVFRGLKARLAAARWQHLHSEYPAPPGTADAFSYSIIYRGHSVRTDDGAPRPARLQRVLSVLQRIRSGHG